MEHGRFQYSALVDRAALKLPDGARIAVWVIPNIEHFAWKQRAVSINPNTAGFVPDVLNTAWRDFGLRVGIWRIMEALDKHGIKGTVALNSDVCREYPRVVEECVARGWEFMGHGRHNTEFVTGIEEADERALIAEVAETIAAATGARPRGWLGPGLTETDLTPDLLAEAGFDYIADWVNDEQPYAFETRAGQLVSIPYSIEINDIPAFVNRGWSADQFREAMIAQFDRMYADGAASARVMAIALHPFLTGHAHRIGALDAALDHIAGHDGVWLATGSEIVDWYKSETGTG